MTTATTITTTTRIDDYPIPSPAEETRKTVEAVVVVVEEEEVVSEVEIAKIHRIKIRREERKEEKKGRKAERTDRVETGMRRKTRNLQLMSGPIMASILQAGRKSFWLSSCLGTDSYSK